MIIGAVLLAAIGLHFWVLRGMFLKASEEHATRLRALMVEVIKTQESCAAKVEIQRKDVEKREPKPKLARMANLRANLSAERTAEQERDERVAEFNG